MSDSQLPPADDSHNSPNDVSQEDLSVSLPNDLPPVEPPSAGMIIQLFLVPAIIVAVIVGVYAAFGQLASQELDWRQLVTDVKSQNPHVRWRGALGLAQMLDADAQRGENTQNLAANSEIATALADLYEEFIPLQDLNEEELKNLEFLSKALGRMRVQDVIVPVFREGIKEDKDRNVRKHSLIGLAMLAGNVQASGQTLSQPELVGELIDISKEGDRLLRHQAAYALGLFPSEKSQQRLVALLSDPDLMTRTNAAIGLSRNDSAEGIPVFIELIRGAKDWDLDPNQVKTEEGKSTYFERMLILINSMKALSQVHEKLSADQKQTLTQLLEILSDETQDAVLKSQILELKQTL
ncbi:MAG: hypothetical protein HON04_05175 [Planctomicrobium sp.]|nr:hypothetical protein [Planctomicrobium sp.]